MASALRSNAPKISSRTEGRSSLESLIPKTSASPRTTAAATSGPASAPRPASSAPASGPRRHRIHAASKAYREHSSGGRPLGRGDFDLGDLRGVEREDPLHIHTEGVLPDRERSVNTAALARDTEALEDLYA